MSKKTRYRRISNGHWDCLQYEKEVRYLIFFKKKRWFYVVRPYYHTYYGRDGIICGDDIYVCSLNSNLDSFVKQWGDINDYHKYYDKEQARLVQKAIDYKNEIEKKRGTVINF